MLTAAQRKVRARLVGASEVAPILGLSPFSTPHDIWALKTGLRDDVASSHHMERGNFLEPGIVAWYRARTGNRVAFAGRHQRTIIHPDERYRLCCGTPDGLIGATGTLECKATWYWGSKGWGEPGTDEVPTHVLCQTLWAQAATGRKWTDVVSFTQDGDLGVWRTEYDHTTFEGLYQSIENWWATHVATRTPPPPDASDACGEVLGELFPNHPRKEVTEAIPEMEAIATDLRHAYEAKRAATEWYAEMSNKAKSIIGDRYGIATSQGNVIWTQHRGRTLINWEAVARELTPDIPQDILEKHTRITATKRSFRAYWSKS